jgi:tRNA threonylcarbamoyl adenosine modification protein YeaZ
MSAILFIDTTQDSCQLGLFYNERMLVHCHTIERQHAAVINSMIASLLEEQQCSFEALTTIAVCAGPGSYTGIRVGIATAQGIGFAKQIPVNYFSALTLLNNQWIQEKTAEDGYYCSVLKARENEVFFSIADEMGKELESGKHAMIPDFLKLLASYQNNKINIQTNIDLSIIDIDFSMHLKEFLVIDMYQWNQYFHKIQNTNKEQVEKALYLKEVFINS